jgi:hypothetical protein
LRFGPFGRSLLHFVFVLLLVVNELNKKMMDKSLIKLRATSCPTSSNFLLQPTIFTASSLQTRVLATSMMRQQRGNSVSLSSFLPAYPSFAHLAPDRKPPFAHLSFTNLVVLLGKTAIISLVPSMGQMFEEQLKHDGQITELVEGGKVSEEEGMFLKAQFQPDW